MAAKKKSVKKQLSPAKTTTTRKIKTGSYKTFRLSPRIKHPGPKLPSAFKLFGRSIKHLLTHRKLFFGILLIYLVFALVFVKGSGISTDVRQIQDAVKNTFGDARTDLSTSTELFGFLVQRSGKTASETGSLYQLLFLLVFSLATIWSLRQTHAGKKIRIRDGFYKGMYPLIPFFLVMLVIALQLLPLMLGSGLYGTILGNNLAVTFLEHVMWFFLFFLLVLLTLYMLSSSLFALYIVTLSDVPPIKALRSARQLVRYRRWTVMRKVAFLPLAVVVLMAIIVIPLIIFVTPAAPWIFFLLSILALAVVHSYMYGLYRELL